MVSPTSFLAYEAFIKVFEEALEDPKGVRLTFNTIEEAITWRVRAHTARRYARERNKEIYPDPSEVLHGRSEYDDLILKLRKDDNFSYIYIVKRSNEVFATEKLSELDDEEMALIEAKLPLSRGSLDKFLSNDAPLVIDQRPLRRI